MRVWPIHPVSSEVQLQLFDSPTADDPGHWLVGPALPVLTYRSTLRAGSRPGEGAAKPRRQVLGGQVRVPEGPSPSTPACRPALEDGSDGTVLGLSTGGHGTDRGLVRHAGLHRMRPILGMHGGRHSGWHLLDRVMRDLLGGLDYPGDRTILAEGLFLGFGQH